MIVYEQVESSASKNGAREGRPENFGADGEATQGCMYVRGEMRVGVCVVSDVPQRSRRCRSSSVSARSSCSASARSSSSSATSAAAAARAQQQQHKGKRKGLRRN